MLVFWPQATRCRFCSLKKTKQRLSLSIIRSCFLPGVCLRKKNKKKNTESQYELPAAGVLWKAIKVEAESLFSNAVFISL